MLIQALGVGNSKVSISAKWAISTIIQDVITVKNPIKPNRVKKDIFSARSSVSNLYIKIAYAATKKASMKDVRFPRVELFSFWWSSVSTIRTTDSRATITPINLPHKKSSLSKNKENTKTNTIDEFDKISAEHIEVKEMAM